MVNSPGIITAGCGSQLKLQSEFQGVNQCMVRTCSDRSAVVSQGQTLSGIAQAHRERVWELAQVLSCNIRGNAGLGVL